MNHVTVLRETTVFPKSEDLHGAAIALVRLQDTYQLNVTELADGHFNGVDHSAEKGNSFLALFSMYASLWRELVCPQLYIYTVAPQFRETHPCSSTQISLFLVVSYFDPDT